MDQSSRTALPREEARPDRPQKPILEDGSVFPLSPHASGTWQKKIRGKIHYFGRWGRIVNGKMERIEGDGWKEALELYKVQAENLHKGRTPRVSSDDLTLKDLCNQFLTGKLRLLEGGELSSRMFEEYKATTDRLVSLFGKTRLVDDLAADDFRTLRAELAKQYGPVRLGNEVQKVRTVFKYGIDNGLIDKAVRYGSEFKKPGKAVLRRHRAKNGKRTFEAKDLRKLIDAAGIPLKAMILLGINAGFGNADCGRLPLSRLDLEGGWVNFPRPKTGIERRCPLWPETVAALREAIAERPEPKEGAKGEDLVFVTKYGRPWSAGGTSGAVCQETGKLIRKIGQNSPGLGFYALRHTFRTVADATKDPNAIRRVMGHTDDSIDDNYTHGIEDSRLSAVAEHVRRWLFGDEVSGVNMGEPSREPSEKSEPDTQRTKPSRPTLRLFAPESQEGAA